MKIFSEKARHWLAAALFTSALAGAFWRAPSPPAAAFLPPPAAAPSTLPIVFSTELLPKAAESSHAASLAQLHDGRVVAAWLAGKPEGNDDLAIWFSTLSKGGWSRPQAIANNASTAGGTFAHVRKVGNPQLYVEGSWLHLWYASTSGGGDSLNHSVSTDGGTSWFKPTRLQTLPFAQISAPPVPLADGGLGLPIYHEFVSGHGEWLRLSATGQIIDKARMPHSLPALQPAVVTFDEQRAIALLRDAGPAPGKVQVASTNNAGKNWKAEAALPVANPNTSVALLRLKSGRLLLAGNPQRGRETMQLWISADEGKTWQSSRTIETAPDGGAEFANPALLLDRDGRIHLAYTWRRQGIKHAAFSEAWLDGAAP